ncbi:MAG: DUF3012 domain-containing protein [Rhodospirillaceae bacterium]
MKSLKSLVAVLALLAFVVAPLAARSPEVGSKEWCEQMRKKPKGEWSANDAAAFAKSCVL